MANCANCRTTVTSHNSWCTACETVQYCGKQCQAEHWYDGNHAEICQDIGKRYWMKRAVEHPGALRRHAKSEHMSTAGYARHVLRGHKHHHGSTERNAPSWRRRLQNTEEKIVNTAEVTTTTKKTKDTIKENPIGTFLRRPCFEEKKIDFFLFQKYHFRHTLFCLF
jgi:hypothetical protein